MRPIALISHPDCLLHEMGTSHPECPARLQVIDEAITRAGLKTFLKEYQAPLATREQLIRVHEESYVDTIFQISPKRGFVSLDPDTAMNPYTLQAALRSAGSGVLAVDLIMQNEIVSAFCAVRPPGHHAERIKAMGFCFFNNVAVAVAHALEKYQIKRVAIVDFDVHHGNGTEDIFRHDERVLYCSSFQSPFYPFSGETTSNDHIINIPLHAGTEGVEFREKAEQYWFKKISDFQPQILFFSAGFDAYYLDDMANLFFQEEDYFWITQQLKSITESSCQGKIISLLEGGYHLKGLGSCVVAHLNGLE